MNPKSNISENFPPFPTNKVSNESLSHHLLNFWKKLKENCDVDFFLKNPVSCQRICSILTNEVSNEGTWYFLSILGKKFIFFNIYQ